MGYLSCRSKKHCWCKTYCPCPNAHPQSDLMQRELDHMSELASRQEQQLK